MRKYIPTYEDFSGPPAVGGDAQSFSTPQNTPGMGDIKIPGDLGYPTKGISGGISYKKRKKKRRRSQEEENKSDFTDVRNSRKTSARNKKQD